MGGRSVDYGLDASGILSTTEEIGQANVALVLISIGYTNTPVGFGTNHALVIATDLKTGVQYATRAGPSLGKTNIENSSSGVGLGEIYAEYKLYDNSFRDTPSSVHTIQRVGLLNISIASVVSRMDEFSRITNSNTIFYLGPTYNSNSYAFSFVESLGFTRPKPAVWAPGWDAGYPSPELSY